MPADPENISFQYLNGVLQYRRGQFAEAKRSFDNVAEQVPDHPPTLANQGVLLANFKRWPLAAQAFDRAMQVAPANQQIVDDVAEFVQLVPESMKKSLAVERMMKTYEPQEAALAREMAAKGLYRFGSKWIDKAALDDVRKQVEERASAKRALEREFAEATQRVKQLDDDVTRAQRYLAQVERDRFVLDPATGKVYQRPYPASYYDAQRDLDSLVAKRTEATDAVADVRKRAADFEKTKPAAGAFTGTLTLIGEDGVPVLLPAPTTQTATMVAPENGNRDDASSQPTVLPPPGAPYRGGPYAPPPDAGDEAAN